MLFMASTYARVLSEYDWAVAVTTGTANTLVLQNQCVLGDVVGACCKVTSVACTVQAVTWVQACS
jgi:hypothetical protein